LKSVRMKFLFVLFLFIEIAFFPRNAHAQFPGGGLYLGVYGGYSHNIGDWKMGNAPGLWTTPPSLQPKSSAVIGLRLGYHFIPQLICEAGVGYLPISSTAGGRNTGVKTDIDLYYHLLKKNLSPFIGAGTGSFSIVKGGDLGGDLDGQVHASLGLRGLITPKIALRAEVRDYLIENYSSLGWGNKVELTAGIDFYLRGGKKEIKVVDRDNDGISDSLDNCPDIKGIAMMQGCPDHDNDGVNDAKDMCPDEQGAADNYGCPVLDRDGDGTIDSIDNCPEEYGSAMLKGCPDRDSDGVADKDDKCPEVTGLPDYQGCVPEAVKKFTGAIKGINFKTGSSTILLSSFEILDKTVTVLNAYETLRIRIEGHTDNIGKPENNQKLSESRAASVKEYFVSKQIDPGRIETIGKGDMKPVMDNETPKGRAANRRIEFTILGQ